MSNPGSNHSSNQNIGPLDDDDDGSFDHYSTAGLIELGRDEFSSHFIERDGRLFHSHGNSPYPLPVDTPEQQRLNVEHALLRRLIGANYVGPVPQILQAEPRHQKLALDLGTGTGQWILEMAHEFPHVQFRGVDIVPIATRYPPDNVQFELHDVNQGLRWLDHTVDLVHVRNAWMTTRDYPAMIREATRVLRPGGLLIVGEWEFYPSFHPMYQANSPTQARAPGVRRFFDILAEGLRRLGIRPVDDIPLWLATSGQFVEIVPQTYLMPIGPWHQDMQRSGRAFRAAYKRFFDAVRPMLINAGLDARVLDQVLMGYLHDLGTVSGLVGVYHIVYARKRL